MGCFLADEAASAGDGLVNVLAEVSQNGLRFLVHKGNPASSVHSPDTKEGLKCP